MFDCDDAASDVCASLVYESQDEVPTDDACSVAHDACDLIAEACFGPASPPSACESEHAQCIDAAIQPPVSDAELLACDIAYEACAGVEPAEPCSDGSDDVDQSVCDASLDVCIAEVEAGIDDPAALTPEEADSLLEPCAIEYEACLWDGEGDGGMGEPEKDGESGDQAVCDAELDVCIAEVEEGIEDPESLTPDDVDALLEPCATQYEACLET